MHCASRGAAQAEAKAQRLHMNSWLPCRQPLGWQLQAPVRASHLNSEMAGASCASKHCNLQINSNPSFLLLSHLPSSHQCNVWYHASLLLVVSLNSVPVACQWSTSFNA